MLRNPGLVTLTAFLAAVKKHQPANYTALSRERSQGYGMVNRYLAYCLKAGFISITAQTRKRGRYPSKEYSLTEKGAKLLEAVGRVQESCAAKPGRGFTGEYSLAPRIRQAERARG